VQASEGKAGRTGKRLENPWWDGSRVRWREGERQGGCRRWEGGRACGSDTHHLNRATPALKPR